MCAPPVRSHTLPLFREDVALERVPGLMVVAALSPVIYFQPRLFLSGFTKKGTCGRTGAGRKHQDDMKYFKMSRLGIGRQNKSHQNPPPKHPLGSVAVCQVWVCICSHLLPMEASLMPDGLFQYISHRSYWF